MFGQEYNPLRLGLQAVLDIPSLHIRLARGKKYFMLQMSAETIQPLPLLCIPVSSHAFGCEMQKQFLPFVGPHVDQTIRICKNKTLTSFLGMSMRYTEFFFPIVSR